MVMTLLQGCGLERRPLAEIATRVDGERLSPARFVTLDLRLQPFRHPLSADFPTIYVHLVDQAGVVRRTYDHPPPLWDPATVTQYSLPIHQSALAEPLPPGPYHLVLGLWDPATGEKYRYRHRGVRAGEGRHVIAEITVTGGSVPGAAVVTDFEPAWPRAEPSQQAPGRLWLPDPARFAISDAGRLQALHLHLRLAGEGTAESTPMLEIAAPCALPPTYTAAGGGLHRAVLAIAPAWQGACSVEIEVRRERDPVAPARDSLDALFWSLKEPA